MIRILNYWIVRMSHPLRGLLYAIRNDLAIQIELFCGTLALLVIYFLFGPFSEIGNLLLIFCFFLVIITELQNSAIETALDQIHPERHEAIGISKDLAAGSVVTAACFGLVCTYFVITGRI